MKYPGKTEIGRSMANRFPDSCTGGHHHGDHSPGIIFSGKEIEPLGDLEWL